MTENVYVYLVDLPDRVDEMVAPCLDGYTVYISNKLSYNGMMEAYRHAMQHINRNDFDRNDVQEIEEGAHK